MDAKEKWINETLESVNSMEPAKASSLLEQKIISGIASAKGKVFSMPAKTKWVVAASIVLLAGLNIVSIIQFNKSSDGKEKSNPVFTEYFSGFNNY